MTENILFVCIGNSCRSQIAEGFTNSMHGDELRAFSAGIRPSKLDPLTVEVMEEVGINVSNNQAKTIESLADVSFDYVVTVCDEGSEECPFIPAKKQNLHHEFPDPPKLTAELEEHSEKLKIYRQVRDEIQEFIFTLKQTLSN